MPASKAKSSKRRRTSEPLIGDVEEIRKMNNSLWMEIMDIAYECNPTVTKAVLREITKNDKKISTIFGKLAK